MENKFSSTTIQSTSIDKISLLLVFCSVAALMIFLVFTENFIFGSAKGNWEYRYFKDITPIPLWQLIIIVMLLSLSIFIGSKLINKYELLTLSGCFLLAIVTQILIRNTYPISMESIVQSDRANGFYSVAMEYSPIELLTQYHTLTSVFSMHVRANLPGKILLFEFFELFTVSPKIMGYLIVGFSTLGAFLIYEICNKLFLDKQAAFYAFILYTLIPGKLFFFPILNTVTPVFMLLCIYLFVIYFERKNLLFLWLLGSALFILVLFDPSPLVVGIVFIGIMLHVAREKKLVLKDLWPIAVIPLLAFLCIYILLSVLFSFDLIRAFQFILNDAVNFNLENQRGYRVWFGQNIKEFFYSVGTPIILIFIYRISQILLEWKTLFKRNMIYWSSENIFILSLLMTFSVVVFLGINRGETSRLWIYLAVLFQIPASLFIAKIPQSLMPFFIVTITLVIQTIVALQRVGFVFP